MEDKINTIFRAFVLSLSFLTIFPISFGFKEYREKDFKATVLFFPIVGLLVGLLNILVYTLATAFFPHDIVVLFILFVQYICFNLFHFDGFLDFFEAIFSPKHDRGEILKIMKDPRIGSFGLFFGLFYMLFKFFLLKNSLSLYFPFFILYPIVGRASQVLVMGFLRPAKNEGLGYMFRDIPILYTLSSYIIGAFLVYFLGNFRFLFFYFIFSILSFLFMGGIAFKKLGGFTGDVVGAANEVGELLFLLGFQIFKNMI